MTQCCTWKNLNTPPKTVRTDKQIQQSYRLQNKHTKVIVFYMLIMKPESKIKEDILFTKTTKLKCLKINLTKKLKDLYNESYKALMREIIKAIQKNQKTSCSWLGEE